MRAGRSVPPIQLLPPEGKKVSALSVRARWAADNEARWGRGKQRAQGSRPKGRALMRRALRYGTFARRAPEARLHCVSCEQEANTKAKKEKEA